MTTPSEAERAVVSSADGDHSGETVLFEGRRALVPSVSVLLLAILTLGLWLIPRWWHRASKLYRITNRRIVVETGVLSKRLEQIDLYRIADYTVDRPFFQRVMGTGNLLLKTFDKSTPELHVREVKADVVALYEKLRVATEAEKAKRGVRMIDYESRA